MFGWILYVHTYWLNFDITQDGHQDPSKCPQKVFWPILMTFICDVKIDVNMCESHYVNLFFFVNFSTVQVFDFLILNYISSSQGYSYRFRMHLFLMLMHRK